MTRQRIAAAAFGTLLGFSLSWIGFTNYGEVHKMFTFADWRMFLVFACGVALTTIGLRFVPASRRLPQRRWHSGVAIGSVAFGLGWALSGACPGVMFAQLGEGQLPALVSLSGAVAGSKLMGWINAKYWPVDSGSCG